MHQRSRALGVLTALLFVVLGTALHAEGPPRGLTRAAEGSAPPAGETEREPEEASLVIAGQEVFRMRAPVGDIPPQRRAAQALERIRLVSRDRSLDPSDIRVTDKSGQVEVRLADRYLFSVVEGDLAEEGLSRHEVAERAARDLEAAIRLDRKLRTPSHLAWAAALTLLATAGLLAAWWAFARLARAARSWIEGRRGTFPKGLSLRGLELVSESALVTGLHKTLRILRAAIALLLAYAYALIVLNLFPWTQPYGRASARFVWNAISRTIDNVVGFVPNLFMIFLIVVLVRYLNRFVGIIFDAVSREALVVPGFHPELAAPTKQLARWLVWLLGFVIIWPYLPGSGSPAFQGIGIFVGLMVSLGSTGVIGNLMSGIVLTYSRSFSPGDRVRIADTIGDVVECGLLSTKIVTIKNEEVTIPNSAILGNHIINFTELAAPKGLILHTSVTIGYDAPWRTVHRLLVEAARATPGILDDPPPFVLQRSLDDFYVTYEVNGYTSEPHRMVAIYSDLHQNIQDRFYAEGMEIMSPHYSALRDGNTVAIPAEKRPRDYDPPAFRFRHLPDGPKRGE